MLCSLWPRLFHSPFTGLRELFFYGARRRDLDA
jgi:hypothetical protein